MSTSFIFFVFFIIFFSSNHLSYADDQTVTKTNITQLVDGVCKKTNNYSFCVKALYTDPRTPNADAYTLAYISFGLAYDTVNNTRSLIIDLLKNKNKNKNNSTRDALKRCLKDYNEATEALEKSFNDLNSETFFNLPDYANTASRSAQDCEAHYKPLPSITITSLCQICVVVANIFNIPGSSLV